MSMRRFDGVGQQLDLHLELAAHRPDADLHDGLEVCGILHRDVDHFGKAAPDLLGIGHERPDRVEAGGDLLLAVVLQIH